MNYVKKLYTKSHFGAIFGPTCMYKKLRNFRTVPPGVTNLVSKCAGNLKEKSHKVSRRELCALQSNRAKCRGGGLLGPPSLFRVTCKCVLLTKPSWQLLYTSSSTNTLYRLTLGYFHPPSFPSLWQALVEDPQHLFQRKWQKYMTIFSLFSSWSSIQMLRSQL